VIKIGQEVRKFVNYDQEVRVGLNNERVNQDVDYVIQSLKTIRLLQNVINNKIDSWIAFAVARPEYSETLQWLQETFTTYKKDLFDKINFAIIIQDVNKYKLNTLSELVQGYINYFEVIDQDRDDIARFTEIFNTIIQIPDEIYNYLEISEKINRLSFDIEDNQYDKSISVEVVPATMDFPLSA
jgi:hypothetical protein